MRKVILFFILIFLIGFALTPQRQIYAEDNNLGVRNPNEALRDVFEPVKDAFNHTIDLIVSSIQKAWEYIKIAVFWLLDLIKPITTAIDKFFEKITGITIGEGFQKIGDFFIYLIDSLAHFIKSVISKINFKK